VYRLIVINCVQTDSNKCKIRKWQERKGEVLGLDCSAIEEEEEIEVEVAEEEVVVIVVVVEEEEEEEEIEVVEIEEEEV
jgi:hypothetical protein